MRKKETALKDVHGIKVSMTLDNMLPGLLCGRFESDRPRKKFVRGTLGEVVRKWWQEIDMPNNDWMVATLKIDGKDMLKSFWESGRDFGSVMTHLTTFAMGVAYAGGQDLMELDDESDTPRFYWDSNR